MPAPPFASVIVNLVDYIDSTSLPLTYPRARVAHEGCSAPHRIAFVAVKEGVCCYYAYTCVTLNAALPTLFVPPLPLVASRLTPRSLRDVYPPVSTNTSRVAFSRFTHAREARRRSRTPQLRLPSHRVATNARLPRGILYLRFALPYCVCTTPPFGLRLRLPPDVHVQTPGLTVPRFVGPPRAFI